MANTTHSKGTYGIYLCGLCQVGYTQMTLRTQHLLEHEPLCPVWCEKCFAPKVVITRLDNECNPCREASVRRLEERGEEVARGDTLSNNTTTELDTTLREMMEVDMSSWGPAPSAGGKHKLPEIPELQDLAELLDNEYVDMFSPEATPSMAPEVNASPTAMNTNDEGAEQNS